MITKHTSYTNTKISLHHCSYIQLKPTKAADGYWCWWPAQCETKPLFWVTAAWRIWVWVQQC